MNKRQGGARNTAIRQAKGDWLLFLDNDDLFMEGSLKKLLAVADAEPELDTIMFDHCVGDGEGNLFCEDIYISQHLDTRTMTGPEFMVKVFVPWAPWNYLYRRDKLLSTGCFFEEHTRFEDADFVLKYIAHSEAIRFLPLVVYFYTVHPLQTCSSMGASPNSLRDYVMVCHRIFAAAVEANGFSVDASKSIMRHATYRYRQSLKRYLWRLPSYKDIKQCLAESRFTAPTGDRLVDFLNRHVTFTAVMLTLCKPVLTAAAWIRKKIKKR